MMSLYEFPPIGSSGNHPICLHETNGRLIYGTEEDLQEMEENALLGVFPKIEKGLLNKMQYSLSRDNVRETFVGSQQNRLQEAMSSWATKGIDNLVGCIKNIVSPYDNWLSAAGQVFRKAHADFKSAFAKSEENLTDSIVHASSTLNWQTNWIRCIAVHNSGHRIAICQNNDYIRIFFCSSHRSPITLKHHCQQNVTNMAWKPFDRMVLAVACSHVILIWRLDKQNLNIRPSANCADVVEMSSFAPITQCFWDSIFDQALFVVSTSSSCLRVLDTSNGETEPVGSWAGVRVRHVWISPNGCKIAIAYDENMIRYEESVGGLCITGAWTPLSDVFFFTTHNELLIRGIHFVKKLQNIMNDQLSYGSEVAIPVYDLSETVLGHLDNKNGSNDLLCKTDGYIRDMKISPDGQRIAVTFSANPAVVALFVVETMPSFFFAPCGLINGAATFGPATILSFFPKFQHGSLLIIVWSAGKVQYIPLLYGHFATEGIHLNQIKKEKLLDEMSAEELLIRESQLSGRESSKSTDHIQRRELGSCYNRSREKANKNSAATSTSDVELFSSVGLYDLLALKSAEKAN
uniref:Aladin n=1 Tax=Setaria digitata TaxID=48799 RepID=A0A915Q4P6_9BILA